MPHSIPPLSRKKIIHEQKKYFAYKFAQHRHMTQAGAFSYIILHASHKNMNFM